MGLDKNFKNSKLYSIYDKNDKPIYEGLKLKEVKQQYNIQNTSKDDLEYILFNEFNVKLRQLTPEEINALSEYDRYFTLPLLEDWDNTVKKFRKLKKGA